MDILITGASGMLGRYVRHEFGQEKTTTLQRNDADVVCDLSQEVPCFAGRKFDLVVHTAGSCDESEALQLNLEGTRNLLAALECNPPKEFVYVSSWEVYSRDSGQNVGEDHPTWASSKVGQSKALAEKTVEDWCAGNGVLLTILRPARMFGKGIKGEMAQLFNDVVNARYIHVRANDAKLSLVCALDVAKAIKKIHSVGGIYNVTDGRDARWIELADAMSDNCGQSKRQTFLPEKWAAAAWKCAPWIPAVRTSLNPETLAVRSKTLTLSDEKLRQALPGWNPFPTIEVIGRKCPDYPCEDR